MKLNPFKPATVESICSTLNKTVTQLENLQASKREDAMIMQSIIDSAEEKKANDLAEAERAEKVLGNVKKLLDID